MAEPSRKLSSEEVNALMEGLKSGDLSASTTIKDGKEVEYKTFSFGTDDLSFVDGARKCQPNEGSDEYNNPVS